MKEKTCAACDCALDESAVTVTIAGKTVAACGDECARKLVAADASAAGGRKR